MPPSTTPKISVVMTVYNAGKYLSDAVESILKQTFTDFEFVIVDNQSTDGSAEMIRNHTDPRIVFISNPVNYGQTKALNIGIRQSRGEFIARMDADDICFPQRLERQYNFMMENPTIGMVGSRAIKINENNQTIGFYNVPTDDDWLYACLSASGDLTRWSIIHPSVMIRKSILEKTGLYREEKSFNGYPQDYELWMRILRDYKIANSAESLLKYRVFSMSQSRQFQEISRYRLEISCEKIKYYLPELSDDKINALAMMLEFLPQSSSLSAAELFLTFDKYFNRFIGDRLSSGKKEFFKDRIKLYYLPQLRKTDSAACFKLFLSFILRHPSFLIDPLFYSKVLKSLRH